VTQKLFTLPGETLVYPAHDYKGDFVSCIYQERTKNQRLAGKSRDEFIDIMNNLNLPMPKLLDKAVPANLYCGIEEEAQQWAEDIKFSAPDTEGRGIQGNINNAKSQVNSIDVASAQRLITEDEAIILDVREKNEFSLGHLNNAINIPRGDILYRVELVLAARDKSAKILIYCASGNRSELAALIMEELGYTNIVSLTGGYIKWKRDASNTY
jgi:rhodanese-related sulfurtransferase